MLLPVHVALGEEPGDVQPSGVAALLNLLVVGGDFVGELIVLNRTAVVRLRSRPGEGVGVR